MIDLSSDRFVFAGAPLLSGLKRSQLQNDRFVIGSDPLGRLCDRCIDGTTSRLVSRPSFAWLFNSQIACACQEGRKSDTLLAPLDWLQALVIYSKLLQKLVFLVGTGLVCRPPLTA